MGVPGSARKSGFLGIPERSVQIKSQMQLLLLQEENKPVNIFIKQQHFNSFGLRTQMCIITSLLHNLLALKKKNGDDGIEPTSLGPLPTIPALRSLSLYVGSWRKRSYKFYIVYMWKLWPQ